jgi:DUF438 domain-containing protein
METTEKRKKLEEYLERLYRGEHDRSLFDEHREALENASPLDVNAAIDTLIRRYDDFEKIESAVARFIRAAGKGLEKTLPPIPPEGPAGRFIAILLEENRALGHLKARLSEDFKACSASWKQGRPELEAANRLLAALRESLDITSHYRKIEYPVFSALEEFAEEFFCTKLMWHLHDVVLAGLKELIVMLESRSPIGFKAFNTLFGRVFLQLGALAYREERILIPVLLETVPPERLAAMSGDIQEYGTSFGVDTGKRNHKEEEMSEQIKNHEERKKQLRDIIINLKEESDIPQMKKRFSSILKDLSPEEIAAAEQALIEEGMPVEDVQKLCEVHVAAFQDALTKNSGAGGGKIAGKAHKMPGHPVHTYRAENKALRKILRGLKKALRSLGRTRGRERFGELLQRLGDVELHFARKENQLFPFLETTGFTGPSKVMWGKHDELRAELKELQGAFKGHDLERTRSLARSVIRGMNRMIFMEEKILYPTALRRLPEGAWSEIRRGEAEIGYAWIRPGNLWDPSVVGAAPVAAPAAQPGTSSAGGELELSVGRLFPDQINLLLTNLPVDITYVDENDKVRYYSQGKERIFPRSPGIIGRSVQNCHPPKSVHVVEKIVEDFKARRRSEANFWLEMNGRFIYIRYFALFDGDVYRGVLEVSQDVTEIRALEGEKRLLDGE